jgi:hypothetical protein
VEPPKKLVVDANIVFSAISTRTFTFELIRVPQALRDWSRRI